MRRPFLRERSSPAGETIGSPGLAAFNLPIQQLLAGAHGYPFALVTIIPVLLAVAGLAAIGSERRQVVFGSQETSMAAAAPARRS